MLSEEPTHRADTISQYLRRAGPMLYPSPLRVPLRTELRPKNIMNCRTSRAKGGDRDDAEHGAWSSIVIHEIGRKERETISLQNMRAG